jgi:hypothetical protein
MRVMHGFVLFLLLAWGGKMQAQGDFEFWNPGAPTYLGYPGGPHAGTNVCGQALVGLS